MNEYQDRSREFSVDMQQVKRRERTWFEEYLPMGLLGVGVPKEILRARNRSIFALWIQFGSTIAGFAFYFARKVDLPTALQYLYLLT